MTEITTIQAIEIDPVTGDFLADIPQHPEDETGPHIVTTLCPPGFHKPRWDGTQWTEGKPKADLDTLIVAQKKAQIESIREQKIAYGYTFLFPDTGQPGIVQLRNAIDVRNVAGIGSAATAMLVAGIDTTIEFPDEANVVHILSPTQAMTMALQAQAHISALYIKARQKKNELANSADPANYDIEAGW